MKSNCMTKIYNKWLIGIIADRVCLVKTFGVDIINGVDEAKLATDCLIKFVLQELLKVSLLSWNK